MTAPFKGHLQNKHEILWQEIGLYAHGRRMNWGIAQQQRWQKVNEDNMIMMHLKLIEIEYAP